MKKTLTIGALVLGATILLGSLASLEARRTAATFFIMGAPSSQPGDISPS